MWVADATDKKLYAYDFFTKKRIPNKDLDTLDARNAHPTDLRLDGETMWVLDRYLDRIFTYKMSDKSHDSTKGFTTLRTAGNDDPRGPLV